MSGEHLKYGPCVSYMCRTVHVTCLEYNSHMARTVHIWIAFAWIQSGRSRRRHLPHWVQASMKIQSDLKSLPQDRHAGVTVFSNSAACLPQCVCLLTYFKNWLFFGNLLGGRSCGSGECVSRSLQCPINGCVSNGDDPDHFMNWPWNSPGSSMNRKRVGHWPYCKFEPSSPEDSLNKSHTAS